MKYRVTKEPSWSTGGRLGKIFESCVKKDEKGLDYEAIVDDKGVSWPVYHLGKICGVEPVYD